MATRKEWAVWVAEWRESGLTAGQFCEGKEFTKKGLLSWSSKLNGQRRKASAISDDAKKPVFARVVSSVGRRPQPLSVRVAGAEVVVQAGFDAALLAEVVRALGGAE